jgi:hypothetical protein
VTEDLNRLMDTDVDARVRQVLYSGLSDGPSPEAMRAAALTLGISAGAATAVAASKPTLTLIVLKWLGIGALAGVVASTAALSLSAPTSTAGAPRSAGMSVEQPEPVRGNGAQAPSPPELPPPPSTPTPRAGFAALEPTVEPSAVPEASVASFDPAAPRDSLSGEIAVLDRARQALRGGDPATALAALDRYDNGSSKHALAAEAVLLRVRALVQSGRRAEARSLAERYVARHPGDGYSVKLRQLAGLSAPAPKAPAPVPTPTPAPQGSVPSASF